MKVVFLKDYKDLKLEYENIVKMKLKDDKENSLRNKGREFS